MPPSERQRQKDNLPGKVSALEYAKYIMLYLSILMFEIVAVVTES